ncbi:expressed unknown protein [Ectocarpus siliculosus]|uniref:Uncharacterized protein n=1 Tax=Ectocarpus siliculosus TaxID=2880 RepID=D7G667_ECTSI|nr:expressed unknown protein [Ectocarpus siliculosus]|eukprot:CBJ33930.1 expressed unknown protein [Ectocarpus siliculosus]
MCSIAGPARAEGLSKGVPLSNVNTGQLLGAVKASVLYLDIIFGGGDGGYNSSVGIGVEKVVAAPLTSAATLGVDAQGTGGGSSTSAATHESVAHPVKTVINPYLKDSRTSGSKTSRPGTSPGSRTSGGGAPTPVGCNKKAGFVPGVGVPTRLPDSRRKSGWLSVQHSPAPSAPSDRPTEVVSRVNNVHVKKSVQAAVAHAVPKRLNTALTGGALKKDVDSKAFNQSLGAVVKQQLSGPTKKFKEDVRKSAADATAEGVSNMLKGHLTKIQQAVNAATQAQEQQSLRNAKSAASLQQATAAFSKAGDGKKLGRPPAHDHPTAELQNYRPGGAGFNIARATSSLVGARVTESLDGLAQSVATKVTTLSDKAGGGSKTPERKANNSTDGVGKDTLSRVLKSLANRQGLITGKVIERKTLLRPSRELLLDDKHGQFLRQLHGVPPGCLSPTLLAPEVVDAMLVDLACLAGNDYIKYRGRGHCSSIWDSATRDQRCAATVLRGSAATIKALSAGIGERKKSGTPTNKEVEASNAASRVMFLHSVVWDLHTGQQRRMTALEGRSPAAKAQAGASSVKAAKKIEKRGAVESADREESLAVDVLPPLVRDDEEHPFKHIHFGI